jgi:hypothetical protein
LSNTLVQHLEQELPDIHFTLHGSAPDVVWVCGYEPGAEGLVRDLRTAHPDALLVVSGRGPVQAWEPGVRAAGADFGCGWPIPVRELTRILDPVRRR